MSYYDDSSLFLSPNGYKTSVLFAQKPMDANGQLAFTRSNDTATRVNSAGLVQKVRTNRVLQSQTLSVSPTWTAYSGTTVTADAIAAPDGTLTADRIAGTSGAFRGIRQTISSSAVPHTFSVYLKSATGSATTARIWVDSGVSLVNVTTDWQRFSVTATTAASFDVQISTAVSLAIDVYAWGAQLETGDIATDYIPTTTAAVSVGPVANVPRLDYLGSSCPRLLLEPQRQNVCLWSEQADNAAWSKTGVGVTANDSTSPDGNTNADKLFNSVGTTGFASQTISLVSSTIYSGSVFAKNAGRDSLFVFFSGSGGSASCTFDLTTLTTTPSGGVTAKIEDYGGGWYRCSVVFTATYTGASGFRIYPTSTTGDGTSGLYVWGAQVEAGAYATSYIPTLGAAVTRGADACSKTGISSLIGQTEGTMFVDLNYETITGLSMFLSIRPNATNKIEVYRDGQTIYGDILGNSVSVLLSKSSSPAGRYKIALAYKSGETSLYINGTSVGTSVTAFSFATSMADLFINLRSGPTFVEQAFYNQAIVFKTRLSNSELAQLTTI